MEGDWWFVMHCFLHGNMGTLLQLPSCPAHQKVVLSRGASGNKGAAGRLGVALVEEAGLAVLFVLEILQPTDTANCVPF